MADVEIMLEQLKENYQIADKVEAYKSEKIKLIERRLDDWDKTHAAWKDNRK